MTDLLHRLTDARPADTELDAMWSPAERGALLDRIDGRRAPRRHSRALLVAAAGVVATAVALPVVVDSGDATAADLHALATGAASYDGPVLRPGTWLHETSTTRQVNHAPYQGGEVYDHDRETWTRWDGRMLVVDHDTVSGATSYDVLDDSAPPSYADPTPAFAATLPNTADGLLGYLDGRVSGSSSHEEALYSALTGLATSHTLPPATLAATFDALAEVEHVATRDVRVDGTPAVEVRFTEDLTSSTDTLVVDRATGQVLSSSYRSLQADFTSTTTLSEVTAGVPAEVRAAF